MRSLRAFLLLVAIASSFLLACGEEPKTPEERAIELGEPGEFGVGYVTRDVVYARPDGDGDREFELAIWYPTRATEGPGARYFLGISERAILFADPEPARDIVIFSHGHQGYAQNSAFIMEHLASHGFMVLAPMHTGNTFIEGDVRLTEIYYLRSFDIQAALDSIEGLPSDDLLSGVPNGQVVMMGHSFGGYTGYAMAGARYDVDGARALCEAGTGSSGYCSELDSDAEAIFRASRADPRIVTLVSMAAGDQPLFGSGVAEVNVPVFQMVAEGDGHPAGSAGDDAYWTSLRGDDDLRWNWLGGAHNSFTDACLAGLGGFIECSEVHDFAEEQRVIDTYVLAWILARLDADESVLPVLDGQVEVHPSVELTAR